ncbi:MAG: 2-C-methyl-D-erythritol 4-phosphate cytidylyltransferase [Planctomycetota bacterium]
MSEHEHRSVVAIVPAAGSGQRFGSAGNKLFADLAGAPIWLRTIRRLREAPSMSSIVMPVAQSDQSYFSGFTQQLSELDVHLVNGGAERWQSVQSGLDWAINRRAEFVAVHDAARPLVTVEEIEATIDEARVADAAILSVPITGTVRRRTSQGSTLVDRRELFSAATPQVFSTALLHEAYLNHRGRLATDDGELVQRLGKQVATVVGQPTNLKITHPGDLVLAEAILASELNS